MGQAERRTAEHGRSNVRHTWARTSGTGCAVACHAESERLPVPLGRRGIGLNGQFCDKHERIFGNFEKVTADIPAERMKMKDLHIVPLSKQAMVVLAELKKHTGNRKHLFPNQHNPVKVMSENTILFALYRMGYHSKATGHGFRATASTILNEHGFNSDVIERQLAHVERNKVRAAYNHAEYMPERRKMMQWWSDYLDGVMAKS